MKNPRCEIDLDKISRNTELIVRRCRKKRIGVVGVTKVVCAYPEIVNAMLRGGVQKLADSRLQNIINLREAGFRCEIYLLRIPMITEAEEAVKYADGSYQSEISVIEEFDRQARKLNKIHKIILMVEVGDLREGILPEDVLSSVGKILRFKNIKLEGLAMNVGCYGGVLPTYENTSLLIELQRKLARCYNIQLPIISGGSTSSLKMMEKEGIPAGVNELRIGEGIFLGTGASAGGIIEGAYTDAFRVVTEIIELKEKPSVPTGTINKDAFGHVPVYVDKGIRKRAILAIGRQDVAPDGLMPLVAGMEIIGASSDHLIVDVTECEEEFHVGDEVSFLPNYGGLLALMTSPYVEKVIVKSGYKADEKYDLRKTGTE